MMQLRPEIELIEVSGRSLRIVDAHLITAGGPEQPLGHDLPDRGVALTAGPDGYTARWSRSWCGRWCGRRSAGGCRSR